MFYKDLGMQTLNPEAGEFSFNLPWYVLAPEPSVGGSMLWEALLLTPCVRFSWPEPGYPVAPLLPWIR